jgi:ribA/ribD-fused uncharacterized protein
MTGVKYSDNKTVTIPSSSLPIDYIQDTTDQLSAFDNDGECIYTEEIEFIINSLETESENDRTSASSYPGTKAGEKCPQSDLACYTLLFRNYPHWRHMLSNDYGSHLELDGHTFASVEHYICANKFKHAPDIYNRFCLDLGDTIVGGASPAQIKKWSHSLPITQEELDDWDRRKKKAMKRALLAKFAQNEELQQVLLLTKNATLLSPCSTKLESLMWVRTILHQSDSCKTSSKGKNKNTNDIPKVIL